MHRSGDLRPKPGAAIWIAVSFAAVVPGGNAQIAGSQTQVTGTWRGTSECVLKSSPCHDETNVYRFSEIAARPGWFSGDGSKVVNGREISMGALDWQYDAKSQILQSSTPNGTFRLVVHENKMEGSLLLPDGRVYRRIHLTRMQ